MTDTTFPKVQVLPYIAPTPKQRTWGNGKYSVAFMGHQKAVMSKVVKDVK